MIPLLAALATAADGSVHFGDSPAWFDTLRAEGASIFAADQFGTRVHEVVYLRVGKVTVSATRSRPLTAAERDARIEALRTGGAARGSVGGDAR